MRAVAFLFLVLGFVLLAPPGDASISQPDAYTLPVGGNQTDYSINAPALSSLTLLQTVPAVGAATYRLGGCDINNSSPNTIDIVFDDGNGNQQTVIAIAGAAGANQQGGGYTCPFAHQGRIRIYGTLGSQVEVRAW